MHIQPTEELLSGRRQIDAFPKATILEDWQWNREVGSWYIRFSLNISSSNFLIIPNLTIWYLVVSHSYPDGSVKIYPAKDGGITQTFPHQSYNDFGNVNYPWRTGDLCLQHPLASLNHCQLDTEPMQASTRVLWHVKRAYDWLLEASKNQLIMPGEHFELPDVPKGASCKFVYVETEGDFSKWCNGNMPRWGVLKAGEIKKGGENILFADTFFDFSQEVVHKAEWGDSFKSCLGLSGIWILLPQPFIQQPWTFPITFREFFSFSITHDKTIKDVIKTAISAIRSSRKIIIAIGFPIPEKFGDVAVRIHWQAALVKNIASKPGNGFLPNEKGLWRTDRLRIFNDNQKIEWLKSRNWAQSELTSRGKLDESLLRLQVLLIGAGAIGAPLAEILIRGGVRNIIVVDPEPIEIGNLVRHTLTMDSLGKPKAVELCSRLSALSPHVHAQAYDLELANFLEEHPKQVNSVNLIIDCTASNHCLKALAEMQLEREIPFVSLSIGFKARRLYLYTCYGKSFPANDFFHKFLPFWEEEIKDQDSGSFPSEGIGCWHPVFPARFDEMICWASVSATTLNDVFNKGDCSNHLHVFERTIEHGLFSGIRKIQ